MTNVAADLIKEAERSSPSGIGDAMDMPTPCPGCGDTVEFDEMLAHPNEFNTMVCDSCHNRIDEENNQGSEKDNYGNTLMEFVCLKAF